jgi:hypothetical protein
MVGQAIRAVDNNFITIVIYVVILNIPRTALGFGAIRRLTYNEPKRGLGSGYQKSIPAI